MVGAATDVKALVNGAQLLDGLTVKGLALQNTNAGTYTFSAAKDTAIANQKSLAVGAQIGTKGLDNTQTATFETTNNTIALSGVFEIGDTISMQRTNAGTTNVTAKDTGQTLNSRTGSTALTENAAAAGTNTGNVRYATVTIGDVTKTLDLNDPANIPASSPINDKSTRAMLALRLQSALRSNFGNSVTATLDVNNKLVITDGANRTISAFELKDSAGATVDTSAAQATTATKTMFSFAVTDSEADSVGTVLFAIDGYDVNGGGFNATDINTFDVSAATDGVSLASLLQSKIRALSGLTNASNYEVSYVNGRIVVNSQGANLAGVDLTKGTNGVQYTSGGSAYTYTVTAENLTLNNDGLSAVISGGSTEALANIASSIAAQLNGDATFGTATASANIVDLQNAGVTTAGNRAVNRAGGSRTISIASDDVVDGNKLTLKIGTKEYAVVSGTGETRATVASKFQALLAKDYGANATVGTNAGTNDFIVTLSANAGVDIADMSMRVNRLTSGDKISGQQSYVTRPSPSNQGVARTLVVHNYDVVEGNEFTLKVGNPDFYSEFKVIADHDDDAASVRTKLQTLAGAAFGTNANQVVNPTDISVGGVVHGKAFDFGTALNFGMSVIDLTVRNTREGAVVETKTVVSDKNRAAVARTVTVNQHDLSPGRVASLTVNGEEFATAIVAGDTARDVAYKLANLLQTRYPNTDATTATTEFPIGRRVDIGTTASTENTITLTALAKLGLADISLTIKSKANAGDFTLTADANTGIGGTSQTINVGQIAAGGSKTFDFDNLGVKFTVANSRATAVDSSSFAVGTSRVNKLTVGATMNGEALFQVGAGTRDNVILDGFKDIRITGYNQNTGAEKEVFDKISATLDTISQNTTASLSTANFATLENQIEDAITMVSDFRSYFGGQQNRIEFAISNIQAQSENLTAANSRIVDTDYAAETANLTKTQIMQQAATAMLAQANQMPNVILALLK